MSFTITSPNGTTVSMSDSQFQQIRELIDMGICAKQELHVDDSLDADASEIEENVKLLGELHKLQPVR